MKLNSYQDLIFWQKSYLVTKNILKIVKKLPRDYATEVIVKQLIRASTSVGANIAEGYARYVGKEWCHFLTTSVGSAVEVDYWLLLLKDLHKEYSDEIIEISNLNQEVVKMIHSTIKTLKLK